MTFYFFILVKTILNLKGKYLYAKIKIHLYMSSVTFFWCTNERDANFRLNLRPKTN